MSVTNSMFLFEVVVESVKNFVESRFLIIKGDFADVFSLELRDPKTMHIVIPEPPPLPPEPPGKKGKKKKPKPKKGKKGKKGAIVLPPPEPAIQSGQSVLFTSNAEFLTQTMKKNPLQVSLWSKEESMVFIGSCTIPWDPVFLVYLAKVYNCEQPPPPTVKDEYNVFQEGSAKLMAKMTLQIKLTYLTDKILSCFRTLSEDPSVKKCLYTGMNSKTTSYMCTLKTTDEEFEANCKKIDNQYVKDRPPVAEMKPLVYADYKNVPGAKLPLDADDTYCCMGHADKAPTDQYKKPETCPDIDFICSYVRKIITSCNDNMRMLTPRPTIRPRIKATDIDRLCYCRETSWPQGQLAERFRRETQGGPCPVCIRDNEGKPKGEVKNLFDVANIRGPCGRPDCKIARDMRTYLQNLLEEDNMVFNFNDIIGPCGSKSCTLVDKIKDFLRHKGAFAHGGTTIKGLSTQCACIEQMQSALTRKGSCDSVCSHECEDSESTSCKGPACPYMKKDKKNDSGSASEPTKVYTVYYFTVEYDKDKDAMPSDPNSQATTPITSGKASETTTPTSKSPSKSLPPTTATSRTSIPSGNSSKFKYCAPACPMADEAQECAKGVCPTPLRRSKSMKEIKCVNPTCPTKEPVGTLVPAQEPSPADSNIVISFKDIHNPCCVKSCSVAEKVKDFIAEGLAKRSKPRSCMDQRDPCYCDCDCNFKLTSKTTYCAVCGGYECAGSDMEDMPYFMRPHACPIYHKLYDKRKIKTPTPWPDEERDQEKATETQSTKTGRGAAKQSTIPKPNAAAAKAPDKHVAPDAKSEAKSIEEKTTKKKKGSKRVATEPRPDDDKPSKRVNYHAKCHFSTNNVPKHMGWLWNCEDIPGMKYRPKWKPGAANKILVRRYRTMREGVDTILKKKRALLNRKKKIEMKPTLVVTKHDGEFTVQMEVFKKYSKDRMLHQYPYDEKPPLIYTIGKTEDTKYKIQRQRERRERRETRRKSRLLQSTFRDKCQEICLKAYNQAIGLLPLPNPNNPDCPCDVQAIKPPSPAIDSCSCSQSETISSSDTDGDDWVIEFTPPLARWDTKAKHPPTLADNECQYNYLDYKVKLLDKQGNPVPRFFKGPDGKQECSDLGGFWSPEHQWLEINKDGYIGPDNRWVPINFTGPDGLFYLSEEGIFTDHNGNVWKIGIDGYVDKDGKWAWYTKKKQTKSMSTITGTTQETKKSGAKPAGAGQSSPGNKSIMKGKVSPKPGDRKTAAAQATPPPAKPAEKTKGKRTSLQSNKPREQAKSPVVMNVAVMSQERRLQQQAPVERLAIDTSKFARYQEIMQGLQIYDSNNFSEIRPPLKTNRASNTPLRIVTPQQSEITRNVQQMIATKISTPKSIGSVYKPKIAA